MSPGTEFARDFCAGIGPLQLGVVLVYYIFLESIFQYNFVCKISDHLVSWFTSGVVFYKGW